MFKSLARNTKSSNNKNFIPLFILAVIGMMVLFIRSIEPEVLMVAYANLIMIFIAENLYVKMIYELNKKKKLLESMREEKSNFLFSMSQDTKNQ